MSADAWIVLIALVSLIVIAIVTGIYNDIKRGPRR